MLRLVLMCLGGDVAARLPPPRRPAGRFCAEGGHVVLIRHAMSPGSRDPANFNVDDCSTQRGLSEQGRQQADRIGTLISVRGAKTEQILSSRYCRCLDTAGYAFDDRKPVIFAGASTRCLRTLPSPRPSKTRSSPA